MATQHFEALGNINPQGFFCPLGENIMIGSPQSQAIFIFMILTVAFASKNYIKVIHFAPKYLLPEIY